MKLLSIFLLTVFLSLFISGCDTPSPYTEAPPTTLPFDNDLEAIEAAIRKTEIPFEGFELNGNIIKYLEPVNFSVNQTISLTCCCYTIQQQGKVARTRLAGYTDDGTTGIFEASLTAYPGAEMPPGCNLVKITGTVMNKTRGLITIQVQEATLITNLNDIILLNRSERHTIWEDLYQLTGSASLPDDAITSIEYPLFNETTGEIIDGIFFSENNAEYHSRGFLSTVYYFRNMDGDLTRIYATYSPPEIWCKDQLSLEELQLWTHKEATNMAITLSKESDPPRQMTDRIESDLAAIRQEYGDTYPALWCIRYYPPWSTNSFFIGLTEEALADYRAGKYTEWDDLNNKYGLSEIVTYDYWDMMVLKFDEPFYPYEVMDKYLALPGVSVVETNNNSSDEQVYPEYTGDTNTYIFIYSRTGSYEYSIRGVISLSVDADQQVTLAGSYEGELNDEKPAFVRKANMIISTYKNSNNREEP